MKVEMLALTLVLGGASLPVLAEDADLAVQIVDALNKADGVHPGFRANHAKGLVAEGYFTPAPAAAALGTLTVEKIVADSAEAEKRLLFLPGQVTEGIDPSDDPLIQARDDAYAVSFSRRNP